MIFDLFVSSQLRVCLTTMIVYVRQHMRADIITNVIPYGICCWLLFGEKSCYVFALVLDEDYFEVMYTLI